MDKHKICVKQINGHTKREKIYTSSTVTTMIKRNSSRIFIPSSYHKYCSSASCHCHYHSALLRATVTITQQCFVSLSLLLSSASCHYHYRSALLRVTVTIIQHCFVSPSPLSSASCHCHYHLAVLRVTVTIAQHCLVSLSLSLSTA